jgi:NADH-quinone oxidoreductase subunit H
MEYILNIILEKSNLTLEIAYIISIILISFGLLFIFVAPVAGFLTYIERRVAGRMQSRIGPNRVGPQGLLQFVADGIKLILKEDIIPENADKNLFRLAPYLCFIGTFGAFVAIPFGKYFIVSDLNIGIFYILAISSLGVVGIIMSGWASNNKWSLLGGMRAAAQIISYEIPTGLAILSVILISGSLSMQDIVKSQGGVWFIFHNPFVFISFFIYFISALAEVNRTPFDIPEAESELVAGYHTEYSGFRFAIFFLSEYANLFVISAIASTLFLGGWWVPKPLDSLLPLSLMGTIIFLIKVSIIIFIIMWLRWTLPRLRVDQLMGLCWKVLIPISFINLMGTAIWLMAFPDKRFFGLL